MKSILGIMAFVVALAVACTGTNNTTVTPAGPSHEYTAFRSGLDNGYSCGTLWDLRDALPEYERSAAADVLRGAGCETRNSSRDHGQGVPSPSPTPATSATPTRSASATATATATPARTPAPVATTPAVTDVYYANCAAARAAGAAPLRRGQPGYRAALDRDNDGIACE